MNAAFDYLMRKQRGAIDTEAAYPYTGHTHPCLPLPLPLTLTQTLTTNLTPNPNPSPNTDEAVYP